jgi:hypothetical protein
MEMTDLAIMNSSSVRMTRTFTRPPFDEISRCVPRIALGVHIDSEKAETLADSRPDHRQVLADSSTKHDRIRSAERRLGVTLGSPVGGLLVNVAALPGASSVLTALPATLGLALSLKLPFTLVTRTADNGVLASTAP